MATITLNYDGRSNVMKYLIEAMLAAGAKIHHAEGNSRHNVVSPSLRTKIKKAREESARGETVGCSSPEEMQQYFDSL